MYTEKIIMANKHRTPISLSSYFDNSFCLVDDIKNCQNAKDVCNVVNTYYKYKYQWSIDHDSKENTRLICKDSFGNIMYLIATKEQKTDIADKALKQKILDTIVWYSSTDDENDITIARKNAQVLYDLLKEVITQ